MNWQNVLIKMFYTEKKTKNKEINRVESIKIKIMVKEKKWIRNIHKCNSIYNIRIRLQWTI